MDTDYMKTGWCIMYINIKSKWDTPSKHSSIAGAICRSSKFQSVVIP